jgi:hypothetical protein
MAYRENQYLAAQVVTASIILLPYYRPPVPPAYGEARFRLAPIHRFNPLPSGIIFCFSAREFIMEAERLNSLSALLADLTTREVELRRYL